MWLDRYPNGPKKKNTNVRASLLSGALDAGDAGQTMVAVSRDGSTNRKHVTWVGEARESG